MRWEKKKLENADECEMRLFVCIFIFVYGTQYSIRGESWQLEIWIRDLNCIR